ncbi:MAG: TolC family protein [Elusimicrobiota bacterium]
MIKNNFRNFNLFSCFPATRLLVLLLVFSSAIATQLFAKDDFLDTCINIAIQKNKKVIAKETEIELAKRQLWVTTRSFLPSVSLQRKYSRGKAIDNEYEAEDVWLKLSQPLYDGNRLSSTHRYYSNALEVAKVEHIKAKEELIYKIKIAYYEYFSSVLEMKEIESLLIEINFYYKKVENELGAKAISELDLEEGKIFKQKVDNMYQKAKNNREFSETKLLNLVGIKKLDSIIFPISFTIFESIPKEIDFELQSLKNLVFANNVDLKKLEFNKIMAKEKGKMASGKAYPKFYFEGSYGKSGEAFVSNPLVLATVWSGMLRLSWLLGGSSVESSYQKDHTLPREIMDVGTRTDNTVLDTKIGLFDDMKYFVEKKEADTVKSSLDGDYEEAKYVLLTDLGKFYNEYYFSLLDAKAADCDLKLKKWRLNVSKKKNASFEISTVEVMDSIFKVSEAVLSYTKAVLQNYTAVTELEKIVLISLR